MTQNLYVYKCGTNWCLRKGHRQRRPMTKIDHDLHGNIQKCERCGRVMVLVTVVEGISGEYGVGVTQQ